jgi:glycosyltransferase involved in cell wall biosynthesis
MKLLLTQTVLSPYRCELFKILAESPDAEFALVLLSDRFLVRPQWKRDVHAMPFRVVVPWGISKQIGEEKEFILNPFLLFTFIRERPDVIICGGFNIATIMAWLYSVLFGGKYVIWTEATLHTDGKASAPRLMLRRLLAGGAKAFIDAGTLAREYVRFLRPDIDPSRLFRAFNCIDKDKFQRPTQKNPEFLKGRNLPERNLIFVGKLIERKGLPALIDVYREILKRAPFRVGLLLIGEGPLRESIEKIRATENLQDLHVEGWVKYEDTAHYYAMADAFILLSAVDHNPLVLLEALAVGVPIVCSSGACNAMDFVRPGVNGYIVDPASPPQGIADRVIEVLGWNSEQRRLCREAAQEVSKEANYNDAAAAFLGASRAALQKPGSH